MVCPKCQGTVYDNRQKKAAGEFKPNAPDFKCADKACGWVQWPPKEAKAPEYPPHPAAMVSRTVAVTEQVAPGSRDDDLVALYWDSFDKVLARLTKDRLRDGFPAAEIAAMTATLFIARSKV